MIYCGGFKKRKTGQFCLLLLSKPLGSGKNSQLFNPLSKTYKGWAFPSQCLGLYIASLLVFSPSWLLLKCLLYKLSMMVEGEAQLTLALESAFLSGSHFLGSFELSLGSCRVHIPPPPLSLLSHFSAPAFLF